MGRLVLHVRPELAKAEQAGLFGPIQANAELTRKKLVDKRGHVTTRYVRPAEAPDPRLERLERSLKGVDADLAAWHAQLDERARARTAEAYGPDAPDRTGRTAALRRAFMRQQVRQWHYSDIEGLRAKRAKLLAKLRHARGEPAPARPSWRARAASLQAQAEAASGAERTRLEDRLILGPPAANALAKLDDRHYLGARGDAGSEARWEPISARLYQEFARHLERSDPQHDAKLAERHNLKQRAKGERAREAGRLFVPDATLRTAGTYAQAHARAARDELARREANYAATLARREELRAMLTPDAFRAREEVRHTMPQNPTMVANFYFQELKRQRGEGSYAPKSPHDELAGRLKNVGLTVPMAVNLLRLERLRLDERHGEDLDTGLEEARAIMRSEGAGELQIQAAMDFAGKQGYAPFSDAADRIPQHLRPQVEAALGTYLATHGGTYP